MMSGDSEAFNCRLARRRLSAATLSLEQKMLFVSGTKKCEEKETFNENLKKSFYL